VSLLAVDMGSSSCKAVAFAEDGRALAQATHSYSATSRFPSWSEMPPEMFWQALLSVTQATAAEAAHDPVEALALSSHGETFIPVDAQQRAIGPAILNADHRAVREANRLGEQIGRQRIFEITGLAVHAMYPLPKVLWLRQHQPDVFRRAASFLTVPGYLLTRLGLPAYVDDSLASRFLAFDIRKQTWSREILSACELHAEQFPAPVRAGTVAGEVAAKLASDLGLRAGIPVVLGGHDQPCAALGSGVLGPGRVSASLGTFECLVAAAEIPSLSDAALAANLNSYCHVVPDRYVTLAYFPSGIMIEWFLRLLHAGEPASSASHSELCEALEAQVSPGPTGLCITPHLLGTCNPDFDPNATGVIAGIRPTTRRADLYKGILEGIACEFATMAELLEQAAGAYRDVYVSGGGGRSRLGLQLRAALANRRLHRMQCNEAVCLGTAILAGIATGKYGSFAGAVEQVVRISETIVPDANAAANYKAQAMQYRMLYSSLAPLRCAQAKHN
jgi:xylulokinase